MMTRFMRGIVPCCLEYRKEYAKDTGDQDMELGPTAEGRK